VGSAAERDKRDAFGRSRGGFSTKACVIADGSGRAIGFALAPGQANDRSGPYYLESRCISHGLLAEEAADASG
jgi:hypothetical protein